MKAHMSFEVRGIAIPMKLDRGRNVHTSPAVRQWKRLVTECAEAAMAEHKVKTITGPCRVDLHFFMLRRGRAKRRWHTQKPDRDNLAKPVLDALTEAGVYRDDCLVVSGEITKEWAAPGAERGPEHGLIGVEIFISEHTS